MRRPADIDHAIATVAARQEGVIDHGQLIAVGLSRQAISRRIAAGSLHPQYRGVYAVGHPRLSIGGRRWAAVRACGSGAALSDATAGDAWGLRRTASALIYVTVPADSGRRSLRGLRVHRRALEPDELSRRAGLPITTPQRTLIDLAAAGIGRDRLEAALHHAEQALRIDWGNLAELLERHVGRPGVPVLAATLARYRPADTRSELERIVLRLCDDHEIPRPQLNVVLEGRPAHPRRRALPPVHVRAMHEAPGLCAPRDPHRTRWRR